MNRFVLQNTFIKIYICQFLTNIYKNKKSKLYFGDCVAVLNEYVDFPRSRDRWLVHSGRRARGQRWERRSRGQKAALKSWVRGERVFLQKGDGTCLAVCRRAWA
jgi:hypothetical protein